MLPRVWNSMRARGDVAFDCGLSGRYCNIKSAVELIRQVFNEREYPRDMSLCNSVNLRAIARRTTEITVPKEYLPSL